jgi:hypothetical protein
MLYFSLVLSLVLLTVAYRAVRRSKHPVKTIALSGPCFTFLVMNAKTPSPRWRFRHRS